MRITWCAADAPALVAADQAQDEQQHDGPDDGDDEAADVPVEIGAPAGQQAKENAAQEGTDDADDDVLQPSLLPVGAGDHAGHPPGKCAEDDPGDDAQAAVHRGLLPLIGLIGYTRRSPSL